MEAQNLCCKFLVCNVCPRFKEKENETILSKLTMIALRDILIWII